MNFDDLVECKAKFYGINKNSFKLGSIICTAFKDASDSYRSSLDTIEISEEDSEEFRFSEKSLALVIIKERNDHSFSGYDLIDSVTGKIWLTVGTDHTDSYYPSFVFDYYDNADPSYMKRKNSIELEKIKEKLLD